MERKMSLAKKFARFAKDAVINTGDFWFTGAKTQGLVQAGFAGQSRIEQEAFTARRKARKAARQALAAQ
jgi:hypothetical protein